MTVTALRSSEDPTRVLVVERWESDAADAAYRRWRASPEGPRPWGRCSQDRRA